MAELPLEPPLSTRPPSAATLDARGAIAHEGGGLVSRLQMVIALLAGLLLVSVPLYLWRRPNADDAAATSASASAALSAIPLGADGGVASGTPGLGATAVLAPLPAGLGLGEVKQVSCSDKGRAVTDCDALAGFNDAFRKALAAHATCLPDGTVGTIEFMADVNFQKKRIGVIAPDDGRTVKKKVAAACAIQIKRSLVEGFPLADVKHDHTKYRHSVVATFGKPVAAAQ